MNEQEAQLQLKKVKAFMEDPIRSAPFKEIIIGFGLMKTKSDKFVLHISIRKGKLLVKEEFIKLITLNPQIDIILENISFSSEEPLDASKHYKKAINTKDSEVRLGDSVGNGLHFGGTICCFVKLDGSLHLLSCNHVLELGNLAQQGDLIISPSNELGGLTSRDGIGRLVSSSSALDYVKDNIYDAALSIVDSARVVADNYVPKIGFISGTELPKDGMEVVKYGRSGLTYGTIKTTNYYVGLPVNGREVKFDQQIYIKAKRRKSFGEPGDSGSIVINIETKKAIGMLCGIAGDGKVGFANRLQPLLEHLKLELV